MQAQIRLRSLMVYGPGRALGPEDRSTVDKILAALDPEAPTLFDVVLEIAHSRPFTHKRVGG